MITRTTFLILALIAGFAVPAALAGPDDGFQSSVAFVD